MLKNFKFNHNNKGFTLIELMIVIAIIGILAAIAVPNFVAYRNKTFCSKAESDASNITAVIADYFAIPTHTAINTTDVENSFAAGQNTFTISATDPSIVITITVTDVSGRCPQDYKAASSALLDTTNLDGWLGSANNTYRKVMQ